MRLPLLARAGRAVALALACIGFLGAGCLGAQTPYENDFGFRWRETTLADHPLVGRVWSGAAQQFVEAASLDDKLGRAELLLLGEVHDNADAHALQGWAIRRRAMNRPAPAVVFEHIRTDQRDALARFAEFGRRARRLATTHDLMRLLDWENSGWPPQDKFLPLFNPVLRLGMPIYPASPPRDQVRAVGRGDASALSAEGRARLELDAAFEPPLVEALGAELRSGHCGLLPEAAIPSMMAAQRYRDAAFADAMLIAARRHGAAILVAGNGHVRTDRAAPWYLRRRAPEKPVLALMLLEVEDGKTDAGAYVPRDPGGKPAADYVIFTPRADRPDPCESLRARSSRGR